MRYRQAVRLKIWCQVQETICFSNSTKKSPLKYIHQSLHNKEQPSQKAKSQPISQRKTVIHFFSRIDTTLLNVISSFQKEGMQ